MKEYKYKDFDEPIKVDDDNNITYKGREIEKYYHGYKPVGLGSGFGYRELSHQHYVEQMQKIDKQIESEEYMKSHPEELKKCHNAEEDIEYFLNMINE